ncbi:hypothetical protein DPMN_186333 [Dreissena polymorpha]|uniref:Uncharacterized protein n=1 Tax=Dreissena polymorpha TaxID=45954 RepID=A0A9D4I994_DREPO|nr:hypothetical protein DPMN_186333 [Dreissena polymorpha]
MTSESTINRRLKEYDIKIGNTYSKVEQELLEDMVSRITDEYPNSGYWTVIGVLSAKAMHILYLEH